MATTQDLIADVNTEVAKLNQMTAGKGYSQLPKLSPITPGNITDNPVPIETKPSEVLSGTQKALIDNQTRTQVEQPDQFTQAANNQAQQLKTAEVTAFEDYITSVLEAPTFSEVQNQVYGEAGVDALKAEVNRLNSEMLNEQDALRTKIEKIQREGGGLKSGAQAEIANLERESLAKQSDIALLQIAATGQWEVAQEAADRAVNAMFEREEKMADVRKEVYNRTKEQWTKAEQRAFEIAESDRNRRLDFEKSQVELLQNTKLSALQMAQANNAPQSVFEVIVSSETPEEVIANAGQWGNVDMLERAIKNQQYLNALVSGEKAQLELNLLKNPVATDISPTLQKKIDGLSDGSRQNLIDSRRTVQEVERMIELVNGVGDMSLLTRATPEGREFLRLRADVTDRLARQRTGAVVGKDEESTFKDILGVGAFNLISSDDQQVIQGLTEFKSTHENSLDLIDPTGEISAFMDARSLNGKDAKEIEAVWGVPASTTSTFNPSSYY